jgi:hypothetical protein
VLAVLKDHRVRAATDRGRPANARCLDRLDAHGSRRKQATEQHPIGIEPETNRLIPVPRLQRLTPVLGDVVRQFDLPRFRCPVQHPTTLPNTAHFCKTLGTKKSNKTRPITPHYRRSEAVHRYLWP